MVQGFCIQGPNNLKAPVHINAELEIIYVKEGNFEVNYGTVSVVVKKGQAAIVFPYWLHSFEPSENVEAYVIMFPASIIENAYLQYQDKAPSKYKFSLLPETMVYADSLIRRKEELTELEVKSLYYAFISVFFKKATFSDAKENAFLRKIIDAVYANNMENVTIKDLSAQCGVSETFLASYLQKYVRVGFKEFVNGLLVNKAVDLLNLSKLSITEIALMSGFGSIRSFNRVFLAMKNCTPTQYRKNKK